MANATTMISPRKRIPLLIIVRRKKKNSACVVVHYVEFYVKNFLIILMKFLMSFMREAFANIINAIYKKTGIFTTKIIR